MIYFINVSIYTILLTHSLRIYFAYAAWWFLMADDDCFDTTHMLTPTISIMLELIFCALRLLAPLLSLSPEQFIEHWFQYYSDFAARCYTFSFHFAYLRHSLIATFIAHLPASAKFRRVSLRLQTHLSPILCYGPMLSSMLCWCWDWQASPQLSLSFADRATDDALLHTIITRGLWLYFSPVPLRAFISHAASVFSLIGYIMLRANVFSL